MLAVKTYPQDYINGCRTQMDAQLAAYKKLAAAAGKSKAVDSFEPLFFNNLTILLDSYFMHRTRAIEGKDGNPLNEVRMLSVSILTNGGVLAADKTVKYKPENSVLGLEIGDPIALDDAHFRELLQGVLHPARGEVHLSC